MSPVLWKIRFEKVADISRDEADAIIDASYHVEDSKELFPCLDFNSDDPDDVEAVHSFKGSVRPEVFDAVRDIAEEGDSFNVS